MSLPVLTYVIHSYVYRSVNCFVAHSSLFLFQGASYELFQAACGLYKMGFGTPDCGRHPSTLLPEAQLSKFSSPRSKLQAPKAYYQTASHIPQLQDWLTIKMCYKRYFICGKPGCNEEFYSGTDPCNGTDFGEPCRYNNVEKLVRQGEEDMLCAECRWPDGDPGPSKRSKKQNKK